MFYNVSSACLLSESESYEFPQRHTRGPTDFNLAAKTIVKHTFSLSVCGMKLYDF